MDKEILIKEANLELQAEKFVTQAIQKLAEDKEDYPISRAVTSIPLWTAVGAAQGGLAAGIPGAIGGAVGGGVRTYLLRWLNARALQGRVNVGGKNLTKEEKGIKGLKKEKGGETYPISRALTSIPGAVGLGSAFGALSGYAFGTARNRAITTAAGLAAGAGIAGGLSALNRWVYPRSVKGRKAVDKKNRDRMIAFEKRHFS